MKLPSLLTCRYFVQTIHVWISGILWDAGTQRQIVDNLTVRVGATGAGTRILALGSDARQVRRTVC